MSTRELTLEQAQALAADWLNRKMGDWSPDAVALRGWLVQRMARSQAERREHDATEGTISDVAEDLGVEVAAAWALCEWAGWPS